MDCGDHYRPLSLKTRNPTFSLLDLEQKKIYFDFVDYRLCMQYWLRYSNGMCSVQSNRLLLWMRWYAVCNNVRRTQAKQQHSKIINFALYVHIFSLQYFSSIFVVISAGIVLQSTMRLWCKKNWAVTFHIVEGLVAANVFIWCKWNVVRFFVCECECVWVSTQTTCFEWN